MLKTKLTLLLALLSFFGLAQCGGSNSNSSKVNYTLVTKSPVLVNADLTVNIGGTPTTYAANWFSYNQDMINGASNTLYWVSQTLTMVGSDGEAHTTTLDPGKLCLSATTTATRSYIAVMPSGTEYTHVTDTCDATTIAAGTPYESIIQAGLNKTVSGWSVTIANIGWFEDSTGNVIERLTSTGALTTQ